MRKKIVAGNWKMNKTFINTKQFINEIKELIRQHEIKGVDVVICPPYTSLSIGYELLKDSTIELGAQNMFYKDEGAYTGEISCSMLKSLNCSYVIIGHSERRQYFYENDEIINLKVKKAVQCGIKPILCVGETLEEREKNEQFNIVNSQLRKCLNDITIEDINNILIAYEPVWAIGTGKNATPDQAEEMHKGIRNILSDLYNINIAHNIRILYGGSVNENNARDIFLKNNVDGGLIGGASLKAESFLNIIKSALI